MKASTKFGFVCFAAVAVPWVIVISSLPPAGSEGYLIGAFWMWVALGMWYNHQKSHRR